MATISDINATTEFGEVQQEFVDEGEPILQALTLMAQTAAAQVIGPEFLETNPVDPTQLVFLDESAVNNEIGLNSVPIVEAPETPATAVLSAANSYLEWLESQAISAEVFPEYTEIIGDAPDAPTVDVDSITGRIEYSTIPMPNLNIPEWDDSAAWSAGAEDALTSGEEITDTFSYTEDEYVSSLIGTGGTNVLYDAVRREIEERDYGIDPATEDRLFERMRERENRALASAVDGATRLFAAGGFTMPTGAAAASVARLRGEAQDKVVSASREITLKQADLYLEAKKIALANGLQIEQQTMTFHNAKFDRLLKSIVDGIAATVSIAAQNLARGKIFLEKYVAFAQAFEARVRASTATAEMYKAQVSAEEAKASFNKSLVDEFVAKNKALVDTYTAEIAGFNAIVDGRVKYHGVLADFYKAKSQEIEYRARAVSGAYDLAEKSVSNDINFKIGKYNGDIAATRLVLDKVMGALQVKVDQIKTQLQATTQVATAAMAGLNVNLGLSVSGSASVGGSESTSEQRDLSADTTRKSESKQWDMTKSDKTYSYQESVQEITTDNESRITQTNITGT